MSQDIQKSPRYSTFDLHQETNVPMIEAFGEKIYEKFTQRSLRTH
jgi:hypothetical protein